MHIPLDYETLRFIWWALIVVLFVGFAVTDGFDLGVGMLNRMVGKTDMERRQVLNTVGPVWDGNQVWLLLAAGAVFAAWPTIYATAFSGLYYAMIAVLFALILRPVSFEFRNKGESAVWRRNWDICLFIAGFVPSLIFGVGVGNLLQGVPFHFDEATLRPFYTGTFWALLNPFALLSGVVAVSLLLMHGAVFISLKTDGAVAVRARKAALTAATAFLVTFVSAGIWSQSLVGYRIVGTMPHDGPSNPTYKTVVQATGAWMDNYHAYPLLWLAPALTVVMVLFTLLLVARRKERCAMVASGLTVAGTLTTPAVAMFPFFMPSLSTPNHSLTVWDASSSHFTLFMMLISAVIFVPLILAYTTWVYRVLRGKVTQDYIEKNSKSLY